MFERRLKIFLIVLLSFVCVLLARAMQLQVVERDHWRDEAAKSMRAEKTIETSRGPIVDRKGAVLAVDEPCIDVCVDYRAIVDPPNPDWLRTLAGRRARERHTDQFKQANSLQRKALVELRAQLDYRTALVDFDLAQEAPGS